MSLDESTHEYARAGAAASGRSRPDTARTTWTNYFGNNACQPQHYVRPRSVDEVREVVARSTAEGTVVRPVGSSHAIPPLVSTSGTIIDLDQLSGVERVDPDNLRATVRAGTKLSDLGPLLWQSGVSLLNMGGVDIQTIAGAVSTATHGAGLDYTSLSGAVTGASLVTASGDVLRIDEDDPRLAAAMTSLGALGVMTSLELAVSPAHYLAKYLRYEALDQVLESWWEESRAHRHYSFWLTPTLPGSSRSPQGYGTGEDLGDVPSDMVDPCLVRVYDEVEGHVPAADVGAQSVDRSYRVHPNLLDDHWDEFEYHVPYVDCLAALDAIRPLYQEYPDVFPIEFRTVKGEPGMLAPAHGRDSVAIGMCRTQNHPDNDMFFGKVHEILADFDARPHWGKGHMMTRERTAAVYPRHQDFVDIRRALDPTGTFLNEHLRELVE